jgi:hypothetical protein
MRAWSTEVMKIGAAGARRSVQTETIEIPTFRMTDALARSKSRRSASSIGAMSEAAGPDVLINRRPSKSKVDYKCSLRETVESLGARVVSRFGRT